MNQNVALIHEGKKPFKCEMSECNSSQNVNMNIHVKSIHEGKNLKNEVFAQPPYLKNQH